MTQSLETLKRRTASLGGIRSVVHTMKILSAINAAPYEHAARSIEAYRETVLEGLHAFFSGSGRMPTSAQKVAARIVIVFGSDHGLCGNYNEALASHVAGQLKVLDGTRTTVFCVGAQMADALMSTGLEIDEVFFPPASVDGIGRFSNILTQKLDALRQHEMPCDIAVSLAYFAREDGGTQSPRLVALLPLDPAQLKELETKPWISRSLPSYSMPRDDLLSALILSYLFATLFRAAAEALVTENAARLALMQQAEQSVDDRLEALKSETRVLRQAEITTELLDVIIGFEALKKRSLRHTSEAIPTGTCY